MNNHALADDTAVPFQFDEIPVIIPRALVRRRLEILAAHPDDGGAGAGGIGAGGVVAVWGLGGGVSAIIGMVGFFGEEVAEEGFEDGGAAADEAGVDFDDAGVGVFFFFFFFFCLCRDGAKMRSG